MALSDADAKRVSEITHKIAVLKKQLTAKSQALGVDSAKINGDILTLQTELENIKEI